jgi:hypothetical protein
MEPDIRAEFGRTPGPCPSKPPQFSFTKENRRVTAYYFYLWDAGFGPYAVHQDLRLFPLPGQGLGQRARLSALSPRLKASPYWHVWYDRDRVVIFQAVPGGRIR